MSLPTILLSGYFALGLLFAFVVILGKKKKASCFGLSEEPALFWLYLLLWPFMVLTWLASDKDGKK
jgi:hypothetical protein